MPLMISDDDPPSGPDGSHFRVFVFIPEFVRKLFDRLVRFLSRRRVE